MTRIVVQIHMKYQSFSVENIIICNALIIIVLVFLLVVIAALYLEAPINLRKPGGVIFDWQSIEARSSTKKMISYQKFLV